MPKFLLLGLFYACFAFDNNPVAEGLPPFPYNVNDPDVAFNMPEEIREISGLSLTANGQMLAAINDEKGIIFLLDKSNGEVLSRIKFREEGDYEGIEIVGNDAWVVKSNGTLYQVKNFAAQNPEVQSFKSFLNKENDVEGLAYDRANNRILIGCKGKGCDHAGVPLNKAIYAFDLKSKTLSDNPTFLLTLPNLKDFMVKSGEAGNKKMMEKVFMPKEADIKFSPSDIAIHPKTGDIYITSARGNSLLILDSTGKILNLEHLKKSVHAQPEGICFDTDGTLFISNECSDGSPGKIYTFHQK
ncbi:MAG: SdiA-regulated domain-containing protein [Saprospiraceae bacterium]|nr:SdiA-regulated domain-containing protein [Saprospiraceae bacterium]MCF8249401.1 SdiA-regulated domain-containing protein [Saprospiraceae bacterium]MCF8279055.1 SdiA-regulated domain-containing protein [Bacteroidales bacterium]MCF8311530.1 SdiA-regulated domain-containing protein [Saprospiraceae bacterium]MCF8440020.1 SdiA-regulated domain-containing protein [Saprospiraceae bacterium]